MKIRYTEEEISKLVFELAHALDYRAAKPFHVHAIMNGGFMFAADFLRVVNQKVKRVSFPVISRGYSAGHVHAPRLIAGTAPDPVTLRSDCTHVILDVVVEEGKTMLHYLKRFPEQLQPDVHCVALLQLGTRNFHRSNTELVNGDNWHIGEMVRKHNFFYGYGMGPWRDLPFICEMESEEVGG